MNNESVFNPDGGPTTPHLDEDLCLDLVLGFLSPVEEARVLAHAARCSPCEKLLQEGAAAAERLGATRVLRTLPGGEIVLESRGSAIRRRSASGIRLRERVSEVSKGLLMPLRGPRLRLVGTLAAAVAVVLVVVWSRHPAGPRASDLMMLPPYSFELEARDVPGAVRAEGLRAGLEAYDRKDFERAVLLLEKAGASPGDEVGESVRRIYLGSALAWTGQYADAVGVLEEVPFGWVPGQWGGEARWTLYVALRESGRRASADSLLQILAARPGKIGDRARRVLGDRVKE